MSQIKNLVINDLNTLEDNLAPDIPIEVLFKYLLKDYHREQQRTLQLESQIRSLLKRNAYLEQEFGKVKSRLLKVTEKQNDYSKEFSELNQAIAGRNNTIGQLKKENDQLKNDLDAYMLFLDKI